MPLLILCVLWTPLLLVNMKYAGEWSVAAGETAGSKRGGGRKLVPMPYRERLVKVLVSVFLGFVRGCVRAMWEAVSSLIFEVHFGYKPIQVAWIMSLTFFGTIPMVLYFPRVQKLLSDSNWMHTTVCLAMMGTLMLWWGVDDQYPGMRNDVVVGLGSLFVMGPLAIHATMSDFVGVKLADPNDWLLNPGTVVLMQSLSKNVVGQLLGPVIGRATAVMPWRYFVFTVLGCLLISELFTLAVFDVEWEDKEERRRLDERSRAGYGAAGGDEAR